MSTGGFKEFLQKLEQTNRKQENNRQCGDTLPIFLEVVLLFIKTFYYVIEGTFRLFVPVSKKSVRGEIALITGAGQGIGKELALLYAAEGATVVCWDINKDANEATVQEIANKGYTKAFSYICNVVDKRKVQETAERVLKEVGDVTILINNAGIIHSHSFLEHTEQEIENILNINVLAHFWILRAFLPAMIKNNHGHIVALSSCAGLTGSRNLVPYCTSKFAVRGMMASLAVELDTNPKNQIKLTTVFPYLVDTGMCKRPKIRFEKMMPMQKPIDVAKIIVDAQRRNYAEVTAPRHLLSFFYVLKTYPDKVGKMVQNFLGAELGSDL